MLTCHVSALAYDCATGRKRGEGVGEGGRGRQEGMHVLQRRGRDPCTAKTRRYGNVYFYGVSFPWRATGLRKKMEKDRHK